MRKSKHISVRVSEELYAALEPLENKSEYIQRLLIKDAISEHSKLKNALKKESHIHNIKVMGRVSNAIMRYTSISRGCSAKQKTQLRKEIISTMECELNEHYGEPIADFIAESIKEFKRSDI